jgi:hypothetical protein
MTVYGCCVVMSFSIASLLGIFSFSIHLLHDSFTVMMAIIPIFLGFFINDVYRYRQKLDCYERELRSDHRAIYESIFTVRSVFLSIRRLIAKIRSKDTNLTIPELGFDFDKVISKAEERLESTRLTEGMVPEIAADLSKSISNWQVLTFVSFSLTMSLAIAGFLLASGIDSYIGYCIFGATISFTATSLVILSAYHYQIHRICGILHQWRHHADNIRTNSMFISLQLGKRPGLV